MMMMWMTVASTRQKRAYQRRGIQWPFHTNKKQNTRQQQLQKTRRNNTIIFTPFISDQQQQQQQRESGAHNPMAAIFEFILPTATPSF